MCILANHQFCVCYTSHYTLFCVCYTIAFPTIWRCAGDFFKVLLKFNIAATDQLQVFCSAKNPKRYGDVQVIFSRFCCLSKWPPRINFHFFVGAKILKPKVRNYSNFTITFPTIWRCAGDFTEIIFLLKTLQNNPIKMTI